MMRALGKSLERFIFPAASDRWLSLLRVGTGILVFCYAWSLRRDWNELLSMASAGPIKRDLSEAVLSADSSWVPRMGWLVDAAAHIQMNEYSALQLAWSALIIAALCLALGIFSRASAIVAGVLHLCAVKSSGALTYGFDNLTTSALFYLAMAPLPDRLALEAAWRRRRASRSELHGFFRRLLQVHLCLVYLFGGIAKAAGPGWWDGSSIWRAMIRPPFNVVAPEILLHWRQLFPAIGISVFILETGYPVFMAIKRTRPVWLAAILLMHIAIGLFMGMYLFALVMIVLNLAAFWPGDWIGRLRSRPAVAPATREATGAI